MTETEYISQNLTKIRRFSRNHHCHVWVVSHPTKLFREGPENKYPVPTPYDISGSAHWRNKADNCITVWRDLNPENQSLETQIHIQKIRKKHLGQLGLAKLQYEYSTGRYRDLWMGIMRKRITNDWMREMSDLPTANWPFRFIASVFGSGGWSWKVFEGTPVEK